jgi:hypothetical protein
MEEQPKERFFEIEGLKQRLERENVYLQEKIKLLVEQTDTVGQSAAMKKLISKEHAYIGLFHDAKGNWTTLQSSAERQVRPTAAPECLLPAASAMPG